MQIHWEAWFTLSNQILLKCYNLPFVFSNQWNWVPETDWCLILVLTLWIWIQRLSYWEKYIVQHYSRWNLILLFLAIFLANYKPTMYCMQTRRNIINPSYQVFNRESYVLSLLFPRNMFIWKNRQCVLVRFNICQHLELHCYLAVLGHANMQWVGKTHKQKNVRRDRWLFTHVISWTVLSLAVLTKDCL